MIRYVLIVVLVGHVLAGCASMKSVRELGEEEKKYLNSLKARFAENNKVFAKIAIELPMLADDFAQDSNELHLSVAKAQLLESMKSPWTHPALGYSQTQKAVALYNLYALIEANEAVAAAKREERRASMRNVVIAYRQVMSLLNKVIAAQELILKYLNQSDAAQLQAFAGQVLTEARAVREGLESSENPKLVKLAEKVGKVEKRLADIQDRVEAALNQIGK